MEFELERPKVSLLNATFLAKLDICARGTMKLK
jgi:hypothetical protein